MGEPKPPREQDEEAQPRGDGASSAQRDPRVMGTSQPPPSPQDEGRPWPQGTIVTPVVRVSEPVLVGVRSESLQGRWVPQVGSALPPGRSSRAAIGTPPQPSSSPPVISSAPGARLLVDPVLSPAHDGLWEPSAPSVRTAVPAMPGEASRPNDAPGEPVPFNLGMHAPAPAASTGSSALGRTLPTFSNDPRPRPPMPPQPTAFRFRTGAATLIGVQPPRAPVVTVPIQPVITSEPVAAPQDDSPAGVGRAASGDVKRHPELPPNTSLTPAGGMLATRADYPPRESSSAIVATGPRGVVPSGTGPIWRAASGTEVRPERYEDARASDRQAGAPRERRPIVVETAEALPLEKRACLAMVDAPDCTRAETFRLLRHRLCGAEDPRIIAVAAPREGEAAALVGAELALAYAEVSSEPVLLLEADTQQPHLAEVLGLSVEHCFALQIYDKHAGSPEPWRASAVHVGHVHVLAVSPSLSKGERLAPEMFHQALADLSRGPYRRIIIVCPRVLDSADVALIAGVVGGVLLTGLTRRIAGGELRAAVQHLAPTKVLGVALLDAD